MAEVALYTVNVNGQPRQMKLSADDAERLGATPVDSGESSRKTRKPPNKARTAQNKTEDAG